MDTPAGQCHAPHINALQPKKRLDAAKLRTLVKVSGSKGLQVYPPLNKTATHAAIQPYARALAQALEREHPNLVISTMARGRHEGKVSIDWSQNFDFKMTLALTLYAPGQD